MQLQKNDVVRGVVCAEKSNGFVVALEDGQQGYVSLSKVAWSPARPADRKHALCVGEAYDFLVRGWARFGNGEAYWMLSRKALIPQHERVDAAAAAVALGEPVEGQVVGACAAGYRIQIIRKGEPLRGLLCWQHLSDLLCRRSEATGLLYPGQTIVTRVLAFRGAHVLLDHREWFDDHPLQAVRAAFALGGRFSAVIRAKKPSGVVVDLDGVPGRIRLSSFWRQDLFSVGESIAVQVVGYRGKGLELICVEPRLISLRASWAEWPTGAGAGSDC